jgi:hypothetical protein
MREELEALHRARDRRSPPTASDEWERNRHQSTDHQQSQGQRAFDDASAGGHHPTARRRS